MAAEIAAIAVAASHGTGPASMNTMNWGVGEQLVFVKLPGGAGLIALDARPKDRRNPSHVGLALADPEELAAAVEAVERAGGRVIKSGEHAPGMAYAYVSDPDGNVFEI